MVNLPSLKNLPSTTFIYVGNNHIVYFENGELQTLTDHLVYHIDSFERDGTGEYLYYDDKNGIIVRADNDTFPLGFLNLGEVEFGDIDEEINESNFYENYAEKRPFIPGLETGAIVASHDKMRELIEQEHGCLPDSHPLIACEFVLNEFSSRQWMFDNVSKNRPQRYYFKHENKQFDGVEFNGWLTLTDLMEYENLIHFEVEIPESTSILLNCEQVISFMLTSNDFEIKVKMGPVPSK